MIQLLLFFFILLWHCFCDTIALFHHKVQSSPHVDYSYWISRTNHHHPPLSPLRLSSTHNNHHHNHHENHYSNHHHHHHQLSRRSFHENIGNSIIRVGFIILTTTISSSSSAIEEEEEEKNDDDSLFPQSRNDFDQMAMNLVYDSKLGSGSFKDVYDVILLQQPQPQHLAMSVERLRYKRDVKDAIHSIQIVQQIQDQLKQHDDDDDDGDYFEQITTWWIQSISPSPEKIRWGSILHGC